MSFTTKRALTLLRIIEKREERREKRFFNEKLLGLRMSVWEQQIKLSLH